MYVLWIRREEEAKDLPGLMALAMRQNLPEQVHSLIIQRKFVVVPNSREDRGGFLVKIG